MIYISCRKNFISNVAFAETNEVRSIESSGMTRFAKLTRDELVNKVRGKRVLLLVHGYHVSAQDVQSGYAKVVDRMAIEKLLAPGPAGYDEIIGMLWPGGWAAVGFIWDVFRARKAGQHLQTALSTIASVADALDVQTHSLGAHVVLEALNRGTVEIRNLMLLGPAVDNESVQAGEVYETAVGCCEHVGILHSSKDLILRFGYRAGDMPECDSALGAYGPEDPRSLLPNTVTVDCSPTVHSHSGYRSSSQLYQYWRKLLLDPGQRQQAA